VYAEEDASHRQRAEAGKHETPAAIDQTGPDPQALRPKASTTSTPPNPLTF